MPWLTTETTISETSEITNKIDEMISNGFFKKLISFMQSENIDKMIILGDTFNNYYELNVASKEISQLLWQIYDKIIIIKGNCDSTFDQTLLPVGLTNSHETVINGIRCYFHHGHLSVPYSSRIKLYASGHTHIVKLLKNDEILTHIFSDNETWNNPVITPLKHLKRMMGV